MRKMRYEVFIKEVLSGWDAEGSGGGGDYSDYGKSLCLDGSHYDMALWRYK